MMKGSDLNNPYLTYCLNIHAGETMQDVQKAIFVSAFSVLRQAQPEATIHTLGPWFNAEVAKKTVQGANLPRLREKLDDAALQVITLNGFPYGVFHGERVKEHVYLPDWSSPDRLDYTLLLHEILSGLLHEGVTGSISTLPVGYAAACGSESITRSAENMAECAYVFHKRAAEQGSEIVLAIEPEPDCVVGDLVTFLDFYNNILLPGGTDYLKRRYGLSGLEAERIIRQHAGICLDTVHSAVCGEDLLDTLVMLEKKNIRVGKIQLGAALMAEAGGLQELESFCDPVYLHQSRFYNNGKVISYADLPELLANSENIPHDGHVVVHYHIPFTWKGRERLKAAHTVTEDALAAAVSMGVNCFELEIYTLSVFPEFNDSHIKNSEELITGMLVNELNWLMDRLYTNTKEEFHG